jgi:hypothetical protein
MSFESQIFIERPSGYCGAHKSIRHMGRKNVAIKAKEPIINQIWDTLFKGFIKWDFIKKIIISLISWSG